MIKYNALENTLYRVKEPEVSLQSKLSLYLASFAVVYMVGSVLARVL